MSRNAFSQQRDATPVPPAEQLSDGTALPESITEHEGDDKQEKILDGEEAADRKRAELKRQFASAATHKSKKRKF